MSSSHGYILVLDAEPRGRSEAHLLESQLQYPVFIADSVEQAVSRALQVPPSLVILVGERVQDWSMSLVEQLRRNVQAANLTIVALTDSGSPQWNYLEETPGLDGFLVKPLSTEILKSLVESAFARRSH
jgi:DNA-binding response OmpR family regulator